MYIKIDNKKIKIKEASSFFERLIGLMFQKNITHGVLFKRCNSIHTFFMRDCIDIIALDKKNTVIFKKENLKKYRILKVKNKYKNTSILELPKNTAKSITLKEKLIFYKD